ncbi:tyrosine-type recombinase/integrase [Methanoculleus sp.]|uniref:tyrosine-type recombinase/integrase n=1 Tax=Methanoculleus sp. TaxID=90427 RepID=UPI00320DB1C0
MVKFLAWVYQEEEVQRVGRRIDIPHYNDLSLRYLDEYSTPDEHVALLTDFIEEHRAVYAPKMLNNLKGTVVQFLAANKIFLAQEQVRRIKTGTRAVTVDRIPDRDEIRAILSHGDLASRAYVLTLISTGMRPSEPLGITWDEVDLDRGMVSIPAGVAKNNVGRVTFLSGEALEALREFRNYFPKFCEMVEQQTHGTVIPDRNLLFPISYDAMNARFVLMTEKAGLAERDRTTGRLTIHLHGFRKYFRTHMAKGEGAGNTIDIVEALLGHEGYLSTAYVRLTIDEIEAFYRKNEHLLWIYREQPYNQEDLTRLERENQILQGELSDIRRQVAAVGDAQALTGSYLDQLLQDPEGNADALRRLKTILSEL